MAEGNNRIECEDCDGIMNIDNTPRDIVYKGETFTTDTERYLCSNCELEVMFDEQITKMCSFLKNRFVEKEFSLQGLSH